MGRLQAQAPILSPTINDNAAALMEHMLHPMVPEVSKNISYLPMCELPGFWRIYSWCMFKEAKGGRDWVQIEGIESWRLLLPLGFTPPHPQLFSLIPCPQHAPVTNLPKVAEPSGTAAARAVLYSTCWQQWPRCS